MIGTVVAIRPVAIQRLGAVVDRTLRAISGVVGCVHSVFDRAVNVSCADGRLITLQGPGPLAAPFAASLDRPLDASLVARGATVIRSGSELRIDRAVIRFEHPDIVCTAIAPESDSSALTDALGAPALSAPALVMDRVAAPAPSLCSTRALDAQRSLESGLRSGDISQVIAAARALIGLGEGLTPAGDDFVVGVLAIVQRLRPGLVGRGELAAAIADAANERTTDIGREFLLHAVEGRFSELVVSAVTAADARSARDALRLLLASGATSGADTAAGLRLALAALTA